MSLFKKLQNLKGVNKFVLFALLILLVVPVFYLLKAVISWVITIVIFVFLFFVVRAVIKKFKQ